MTWVKVDDRMPRHPKIIGLSVQAKWALLELWCYAAEHQTDGIVPAGAARSLTRPATLATLAQAGLIHQVGEGWLMHDWLDHNVSAAEYAEKKAQTAERQRKWRETHRVTDGTFRE